MSGCCIWRCANSAFKLWQAYEFWITGWSSEIATGVGMGQILMLVLRWKMVNKTQLVQMRFDGLATS